MVNCDTSSQPTDSLWMGNRQEMWYSKVLIWTQNGLFQCEKNNI